MARCPSCGSDPEVLWEREQKLLQEIDRLRVVQPSDESVARLAEMARKVWFGIEAGEATVTDFTDLDDSSQRNWRRAVRAILRELASHQVE